MPKSSRPAIAACTDDHACGGALASHGPVRGCAARDAAAPDALRAKPPVGLLGAAARGPLRARPPSAEPEPDCVFVVDDHDDTRDMLIEALGAAGVHGIGFASAEQALVALRAIRPVAVLTDYTLSDLDRGSTLDGRDLAQKARELVPGLPVIVLTGHAHVAGSCPEFDLAFLKPFELDEVVAAIRALACAGPA